MSLPGNRIHLFDTSIWEYTEHPLIAADWDEALRNDQLDVSPIVAFEVFYIAKNQADFEHLERQLDSCPTPMAAMFATPPQRYKRGCARFLI